MEISCHQNQWLLADPRSVTALAIHHHLAAITLPLPEAEDLVIWEIEGKSYQYYPTSQTWDLLRPKQSAKEWAVSIWFKGAIPKNAFNMWVSTLDRLPTRARLTSWGIQVPSTCCLCSEYAETRDHLLLRCGFSSQIWNLIQVRLHLSPCVIYSWNALIAWTRMGSATSPSLLQRLVAHAAIYHIWKQRNNLLHNGVMIPALALFTVIDREVRNTINARRSRKNFRELMLRWIR